MSSKVVGLQATQPRSVLNKHTFLLISVSSSTGPFMLQDGRTKPISPRSALGLKTLRPQDLETSRPRAERGDQRAWAATYLYTGRYLTHRKTGHKQLVMGIKTHSAVSVEAANTGANDGTSSSCSVAAHHVDSTGSSKVNGSGVEPRGHVGGCVGGGPASRQYHQYSWPQSPRDDALIPVSTLNVLHRCNDAMTGSGIACVNIVQRQPNSLVRLSRDSGKGAHLNMEAQPAPDQTEWTTTGYTQAAMKKEYRAYASTRARSAMAPDTMVHAVAANCA